MKNPDISSLEHTSWRCQYHVVFAPKYRRMEIYREIRADIGVIIRKLCQQKGVEIIEANACPDHIHMLISIPPKYSVSQIMGYLKGKSSLMIFDRHANLKYKYGNRHFWARGYFVDTVGRNKKAIKAYIQNQLQEDQIADQISIKEFVDPFTGSKNTKAYVADGLFCREIDGLFCRSSPDIIVRRRCVLSHKRRGWLQPSPSFRYSRNLALQDELYHPVINNGPAVLVCVDKRLGTGPVNQSRDAG